MQKTVLPDKRLSPDHYINPERTEFVRAGDIIFGVEYRFVHHRLKGGQLADEVKDHGVTIHVLVGGMEQEKQRLRFDCLEMRPHYHYMDWTRGEKEWFHQTLWLDTVVEDDSLRWALEKIRTKLAAMLMRARAVDEARSLDQAQIEAALPKVAAWARIQKERALSDWRGPISLSRPLAQLYKQHELPGHPAPARLDPESLAE